MLKIEIPFDPGIPLLGIYSKNAAALFEKDRCTAFVYRSTIYNSQEMEAT